MTRHLIIGFGEVGKALFEVLKDAPYEVRGIDKGEKAEGLFDVLHICIPFNEYFVGTVTNYAVNYLMPHGLVIIHSSVAVGTTDSIRYDAVHSPIRGLHPNLAEGIRTFTKFFGGQRATEAACIFESLGIDTFRTPNARNTEALKLWDTTYYGWNIVFEKAVRQYCDDNDLDFDLIYREANGTYNQGYVHLGKHWVQRPVLHHRDGPIGGHCVIPNAKLLDSFVASFILQKNQEILDRQEWMRTEPQKAAA